VQSTVAHAPAGWSVLQLIWFGSYYGSAAVNPWFDRARNDALELASAVYPRRWKADDVKLTQGYGAYIGAQVRL